MIFEDIKGQIQEDFNKVLSFTQGFVLENLHTDNLLKQWFDSKKVFIDKMGGLIYEVPQTVNFELSEREKTKKVNNFIEYVEDVYKLYDLARFLNIERAGFFSNTIIQQYPLSSTEVISKGMKLVKAFKYFIEDSDVLNLIQSEASRIIQENKVEGTLCFSVHPLDFLSLSENACNWRSCHALDGDYRTGNLSYMCDSSTIICYLKSKTDKNDSILPSFPSDVKWNSKKWRVLFFINKNKSCIFAGRQYPFTCENSLNIVSKYLDKPLNIDFVFDWSYWHNDQLSSYIYKEYPEDNFPATSENRIVFIDREFFILEDLIRNNSELQFNDLLKSNYYTPYYCWNRRRKYPELIEPIYVGSNPICPICGKHILEDPSIMCCESCLRSQRGKNIVGECDLCHRTLYEDSQYNILYYDIGGESGKICQSCIETETQICEICEERFLTHEGVYSNIKNSVICPTCARKEENINGS